MKLRSLELHNYRRHHRTNIEWPDGVVAVIGRNGSGKSTILEAIGFALFGVPATRTGKDLLRWDGAGPMDHVGVALEFELAGEAIRIHRELRGKALTPSATLTVDGRVAVDPGAGSNEAVTQDIERRFGMDRDTFFTTLVAKQGDLDRLANMTPARRKQLLLEMLGIDALDRAIERARQERRDLETKVEAIRSALPDEEKLKQAASAAKQAVAQAAAEEKIHDESWARNKKLLSTEAQQLAKLEEQGREHAAIVAALEQAKASMDMIAGQLDEGAKRLDAANAAQAEYAALEPTAASLPDLRKRLEIARSHSATQERVQTLAGALAKARAKASLSIAEAQALIGKANDQRNGLQQELALAKARANQDRAHIDELGSLGDAAECPTCMRPLETHLPQLLERLQASEAEANAAMARAAEQLPGIDEQTRVAQDALQAATELQRLTAEHDAAVSELAPVVDGEDIQTLQAQAAAAEAAHEQRLRLHATVNAIADLQAAQATLQSRHVTLSQEFETQTKQLAALQDPAEALAAARKKNAELAAAERDAERALLAARSTHELAKRDLATATARVEERTKQAAHLRTTEEEAQYWAGLASGRGKGLLESFKAHLVARIGPAIGREASRLLERFTGGRYTEVTLDAEYNVYVSDAGRRYSLDRFSGGESDLVHLAIRLAVSRLLVERSSAEMRFLALDEVFGSLDEERRTLVLAALQELGSLYSQVMLVTHHDSLRDALDASLLVEERDGTAVVSLHAG